MEKRQKLPGHVGIIMDGNGRWAQERGLSRSLGHKAGSENLKSLCTHIFDLGIPILSVFAFSTENFKRDAAEVQYLMQLFVKMFEKEFTFLKEKDVRVLFSGRRENLPKEVLRVMDRLVEETANGSNGIFHICLNYGGQTEILDLCRKISEKVEAKEISSKDIDFSLVRANLYQDLPDLDLVIRTSGEQRISNFMLYQSAYAEYYFPKVYFPDFDAEQFDLAIEEFQKRTRKFGGTK